LLVQQNTCIFAPLKFLKLLMIMNVFRRIMSTLLLVVLFTCLASGKDLNSIHQALIQASHSLVQEKVYIHTDNTCYFVGDTLWYKAYVVRADNLKYTDMSRILYVELLSPEGLLVERQRVILSNKGYSCGNFALRDSLYSGYYEIRAYTKWMLNFNVDHERYMKHDAYLFYNYKMASDYFRKWDGLYSRVIPIYSKPDHAGDFTYKRIYQRPKQRLPKPRKQNLQASFFPEGGELVTGLASKVAFELTDQDGQAVQATINITDGKNNITKATSGWMGRGTFTYTPNQTKYKATVNWNGKTYSFPLPQATDNGTVITLQDNTIHLSSHNIPTNCQYGLSILCRGVLKHFQEIKWDAQGKAIISEPQLPTGVNDITVFDSNGKIWADRLIFVNNHDFNADTVHVSGDTKLNYKPYEHIELDLQAPQDTIPALLSVAVRDTRTDEPSYDNSNIMTDMLLGSELKGFIAYPAHYFEKDDAIHHQQLDELMMIQGWRKYKWNDLSDTSIVNHPRYEPEKTLTVEGNVYKMLDVHEVQPEEISHWLTGTASTGQTKFATDETSGLSETTTTESDGLVSTEEIGTDTEDNTGNTTETEYGNINDANTALGINHGGLSKEVMVEAEVSFGKDVFGSAQRTNHRGRYEFQIPPFYGTAVLNMKAYNENDSVKKNMQSRKDSKVLDENAYPDYFVKREMFYPIFTTPYSYYQNHAPEYVVPVVSDSVSNLSMENDVHQLQNINVKGKRRGRRAIDYTKPAYVRNAYDLYNDITDYGLSFGKYDMRSFPIQIARFLYGNMGRYNKFNVDARYDRYIYYRSFTPDENEANKPTGNRTPQFLYNNLLLKRLQDVKVYTDYEPRNADSTMEYSYMSSDVTVEFVPIPDDGTQPTFRDRHYMLEGFSEPADFYQPNYSLYKPIEPTDYRRTLYWNPNLATDKTGKARISFFNNSKETRIKVSVAGLEGGKLIH
jgi:hypothetical protein